MDPIDCNAAQYRYKMALCLALTLSTGGSIVVDKNCEKIHYIAHNIYCCGAGIAADTENTTALISSQLELHRLVSICDKKMKDIVAVNQSFFTFM
ncbi:hypothetical protein PsorP6_000212 [Peronosclerospora sorghi]|uniref:Uncharacterized protein n=1 Tax=Peronosclerospora sorghi TaxID=230839 RepID=A0ACC0WRX8_9STRA|nr:hypothetical protein PsorP6_000212 [Peronosclerospora sorghi]